MPMHRPLKLQLFIHLILARVTWMPVGMSAACKADVSWIIACPSNFAYLTSVLGLEIASRLTFETGFLKLSTASWQTGACSTIRTESARGLSQLAGGVPTLCSQSSRPFPSSRFRIRLTNVTHGLGHQCMHIRGFELFGAILPPWRIDA